MPQDTFKAAAAPDPAVASPIEPTGKSNGTAAGVAGDARAVAGGAGPAGAGAAPGMPPGIVVLGGLSPARTGDEVLRDAARRGITVRKARVSDVPQVHAMINHYAALGNLLKKTLAQLYETLQEMLIAEAGGKVIGCAGIHIDCPEYAELRSVAVDPGWQGKGVGSALVEMAMREAALLGVERLFVLTDKAQWFAHHGFVEMDRADLPRKIWRDCVNCPAFTDCHEVAMQRPVPLREGPPTAPPPEILAADKQVRDQLGVDDSKVVIPQPRRRKKTPAQ